MLKAAEILAYIVVAIQLGLLIFGNMTSQLVPYIVWFLGLLCVEWFILTKLGFRFYDGERGASWNYVICILLDAGVAHQITGRLYERP